MWPPEVGRLNINYQGKEFGIAHYLLIKKLYTLNSTLTTDSKLYTLNPQLKRPSDKDRPMYTIFWHSYFTFAPKSKITEFLILLSVNNREAYFTLSRKSKITKPAILLSYLIQKDPNRVETHTSCYGFGRLFQSNIRQFVVFSLNHWPLCKIRHKSLKLFQT